MNYQKIINKLFAFPCAECGEIKVLFWKARCNFCDSGEGKVK